MKLRSLPAPWPDWERSPLRADGTNTPFIPPPTREGEFVLISNDGISDRSYRSPLVICLSQQTTFRGRRSEYYLVEFMYCRGPSVVSFNQYDMKHAYFINQLDVGPSRVRCLVDSRRADYSIRFIDAPGHVHLAVKLTSEELKRAIDTFKQATVALTVINWVPCDIPDSWVIRYVNCRPLEKHWGSACTSAGVSYKWLLEILYKKQTERHINREIIRYL